MIKKKYPVFLYIGNKMKTRGVVRSFDTERGRGTVWVPENVITGHVASTYWIYGRHVMSIRERTPRLNAGQWIEFDVYDNSPGMAYNIRRFGGSGLFDEVPEVPKQFVLKKISDFRFRLQLGKLQSNLTAFLMASLPHRPP